MSAWVPDSDVTLKIMGKMYLIQQKGQEQNITFLS